MARLASPRLVSVPAAGLLLGAELGWAGASSAALLAVAPVVPLPCRSVFVFRFTFPHCALVLPLPRSSLARGRGQLQATRKSEQAGAAAPKPAGGPTAKARPTRQAERT